MKYVLRTNMLGRKKFTKDGDVRRSTDQKFIKKKKKRSYQKKRCKAT